MITSPEYIAQTVKEVEASTAPEDVKRAAIQSIEAGNEYRVWRAAHAPRRLPETRGE